MGARLRLLGKIVPEELSDGRTVQTFARDYLKQKNSLSLVHDSGDSEAVLSLNEAGELHIAYYEDDGDC